MEAQLQYRTNPVKSMLEKIPPQALDLEAAVLGAMMVDRDALDILGVLSDSDFYAEANALVFQAIGELFKDGNPVDMITVTNQLRKNGTISRIPENGAYYVAQLTMNVTAANVEYHARVVREMAIKRNLIAIAGRIESGAYQDGADAFELIDYVQTALLGPELSAGDSTQQAPSQVYANVIHLLQGRKDMEVTGVPSGFSKVDGLTAGWQPTDLIIIAARPGMGKTAFVISCAENAGVPVDLYSLEMSASQLTERRISGAYEIDNYNLRRGKLTENEWQLLTKDQKKIQTKPIYIDDSSALSITELRIRAMRRKKKHGTGLVIVDYLQLMKGNGNGNREQEISSISRGLKALAKDLNVPVIALSQLSRAVETRGGDKRPQLSDLRESGSIEQDADIVSFLYRPEYYGIVADSEGLPTTGKAEFIIAKNRHGSTEAVWIDFVSKYSKFTEHREQTSNNWLPYKDNDESPF